MRVLHLRAGNLYGGVETTMVEQARYRPLSPEMELHFALCFNGRLKDELLATGSPVDLMGEVRIRNPATIWRARRRLSELLRRKRFDVAISHSSWEQVIFAPVVRSAGLPMVFWLHDATNGRHWLEQWARMSPPDLALCNSYFTLGHLPNIYPQTQGKVIYNPLVSTESTYSSDELAAVRAQLKTPKAAVVIIQFSRMEEWKGHALHLKALSMLNDLPDWSCWQVGGAQRLHEVRYLEQLKQMTADLGLVDRVRFLGQRTDVRKLLAASDIHCQPNTGPEPFGNVFIEALFAGVPVVTTGIGGAKEILNEECGLLVPKDDASALVTALRKLIQDPSLRKKLGAVGPSRARMLCDVGTQMKRLKDVLTALTLQEVAA